MVNLKLIAEVKNENGVVIGRTWSESENE